ncbi:glucosidase 2 subunit beta isoform X3 [Chelonia mydas]|uniref:glucosidase 2 subunit beta isoform X3 n=1 Tax=Chelonia mydas TaxID=8469 RepID=UPI0018A1BE68|nr:glucosidase 2 subunit beta isoform X3 [Chelonia mydas]
MMITATVRTARTSQGPRLALTADFTAPTLATGRSTSPPPASTTASAIAAMPRMSTTAALCARTPATPCPGGFSPVPSTWMSPHGNRRPSWHPPSQQSSHGEMGRKEREALAQMAEVAREGFQLKQVLIEEASKGREDKQRTLAELQEGKKSLEEQVETLKSGKEAAEKPEKEAKEIHQKNWEEQKAAEKAAREQARASEAFQDLDDDGDGLVSVAELQTHAELDVDGDGTLSETEAQTLLGNALQADASSFQDTVWAAIKENYKPEGLPDAVPLPEAPREEAPEPQPDLPLEQPAPEDDYDDEEEEEGDDDESNEEEPKVPPPKQPSDKAAEEDEEEKMPPYDEATQALIDGRARPLPPAIPLMVSVQPDRLGFHPAVPRPWVTLCPQDPEAHFIGPNTEGTVWNSPACNPGASQTISHLGISGSSCLGALGAETGLTWGMAGAQRFQRASLGGRALSGTTHPSQDGGYVSEANLPCAKPKSRFPPARLIAPATACDGGDPLPSLGRLKRPFHGSAPASPHFPICSGS